MICRDCGNEAGPLLNAVAPLYLAIPGEGMTVYVGASYRSVSLRLKAFTT